MVTESEPRPHHERRPTNRPIGPRCTLLHPTGELVAARESLPAEPGTTLLLPQALPPADAWQVRQESHGRSAQLLGETHTVAPWLSDDGAHR